MRLDRWLAEVARAFVKDAVIREGREPGAYQTFCDDVLLFTMEIYAGGQVFVTYPPPVNYAISLEPDDLADSGPDPEFLEELLKIDLGGIRDIRASIDPFRTYRFQAADGRDLEFTGADLIEGIEAVGALRNAVERGEPPEVLKAASDRLDATTLKATCDRPEAAALKAAFDRLEGNQ
jgi:hypothetical protein